MFVTLVVVSAYSDIPQLKPIKKQIESFKSGMGVSDLSVGKTGEIEDLAVTLIEYKVTDSWIDYYNVKHAAPEGAKYLFIHIKVGNIGKVRKTLPGYTDFSLWYAGVEIPYSQACWYTRSYSPYIGHSLKYPGYSDAGWIAFEVPVGIELGDTTLNIRGLVWRLG